MEQLKACGVVIEFVNFENSVESPPEAVKKVGRIPDAEDKAGKPTDRVRREIEKARALIDTAGRDEKTAAFVYAQGAGPLMVAGRDTSGSAVISLAGRTPAVTEYEGDKPLTLEALVDKNPKYPLFTTTPRCSRVHL